VTEPKPLDVLLGSPSIFTRFVSIHTISHMVWWKPRGLSQSTQSPTWYGGNLAVCLNPHNLPHGMVETLKSFEYDGASSLMDVSIRQHRLRPLSFVFIGANHLASAFVQITNISIGQVLDGYTSGPRQEHFRRCGKSKFLGTGDSCRFRLGEAVNVAIILSDTTRVVSAVHLCERNLQN